MQLSKSRKAKGVSFHFLSFLLILTESPLLQLKPLGFFATGRQSAARETPLGLYKGLGAVVSGIVPKMAIRFASFESKSYI